MTPHHDREVRYWTPGEDDDVPFGFHETNLAPWEQPYALEDDKEQE
jgi:hypothetical protein